MPGKLVIPLGYAQCSYELRQDLMARSAFITWGVGPTDPGLDITTLAKDAFNATGSLKTLLDANWKLYSTRVTQHQDAGLLQYEDNTIITGTRGAGVSVPPNVAVLVRKTTTFGGRRGRGRWFLPGMIDSPNVQENGVINPASLAIIQTALNVWRAAYITATVPLVLLHNAKRIGGAGTTGNPYIYDTPPAPYPINSLQAVALVATQRRRLGR
jgi:hypothetical protein